MMIKKKKPLIVVPCYDRNRHTCIQVERDTSMVKFIPLDIIGLEVYMTPVDSFDQRYTPMEEYPVEKACQLFVNYSQTLGATKEAMDYLGQVINISEQELEMATKKQAATEDTMTKKTRVRKTASVEADEVEVKSKPVKPRKLSAAQMFQNLIMAGKLTDDQIFEKVQAEFGLDEKKRGYVKWYRNWLKKHGQNPPEAKVTKGAK